jgi:hypothetical protein
MEMLYEIIKLLFVGLLAGFSSSYFALSRYKHEKWWEMRVTAYKDCIEELSDLSAKYGYELDKWFETSTGLQGNSSLVRKSVSGDENKVRKLRDMGAFLFSKEAEDALTTYVETNIDWDHVADPEDIYGPLSHASRKCLDQFVAISIKDLGIKKYVR